MDRLVSVDVKEVELVYRPSHRCASAAFRVTNLMHTMAVAVHLNTTRPALFSISPHAAAVLPPLSSATFTLLLPPTTLPPIAAPPDTVLVRSAVLPTGKATSSAVVRLFSRPGVKVFRDAAIPITLTGPHLDLPGLLRRAAAAGDSCSIAALLRAGADHASLDPDGDSALCLAVASGSAEAVEALLDAGARPEHRPFRNATAAGRADVISLLAGKTLYPNWGDAADVDGRTPVHLAAVAGDVDSVRLCLDSGGGDPDRPDERGWTPLHCAAAGGQFTVAELLVARSAYDAKCTLTGQKNTPFDLAVEAGHAGLYDTLRLSDALHAAARCGDVSTVNRCVAMGAEVDSRDQNGWTALHRAAFKGKIEVVRALIGHGANVDAVDDNGYTPLRCVVEAGHADVAVFLVAHGARAATLKGLVRGVELLSRVMSKMDTCCAAKACIVSSLREEMMKLSFDVS